MPSNAADAVELLRVALRGANPTIFFEHRSLLMTMMSNSCCRGSGRKDHCATQFNAAPKVRVTDGRGRDQVDGPSKQALQSLGKVNVPIGDASFSSRLELHQKIQVTGIRVPVRTGRRSE